VLKIREHMVQYENSEDLISIGAYRRGTDPRIDAAIAMRDPINILLRQHSDEQTPMVDSHAMVMQLAAAQIPPAQVHLRKSRLLKSLRRSGCPTRKPLASSAPPVDFRRACPGRKARLGSENSLLPPGQDRAESDWIHSSGG